MLERPKTVPVAPTPSLQSDSPQPDGIIPDCYQIKLHNFEDSVSQSEARKPIQATDALAFDQSTQSQQPPPYSVSSISVSPTTYVCPVHHYPLHVPHPFSHPMTNMPAQGAVYPMPPASYIHPAPAYPQPQGYGPLSQLQYAAYYGEASSSLMPMYPANPAMPGVVLGDATYIANAIHCSICNGRGHTCQHMSYSAQAVQYQATTGPGNVLMTANITPLQSPLNGPSNESYARRDSSGSTIRGYVKGVRAITKAPVRKSKYSGNALWVGNLPSRVTIMSLKDYFSQDFDAEIVSLFLIAKSNCAFVNYRSATDCARAIQKFHSSRFQGTQLVCRLRKTSSAGSGSSTPSPGVDGALLSPRPSSSPSQSAVEDEEVVDDEDEEGVIESGKSGKTNEADSSAAPQAPERYFIMKSLTMQDLVQSVQTNTWATQRHNEETLNNAYKSADTVYLIFSVNRSREYFGYSRMASLIANGEPDPNDMNSRTSRADVLETRITITPATEYAPKGRIVEDLFRGTILWEAERDGDEKSPNADVDENQTWGKPFKVEWISTKRIPFYRARGLRNRWNANKEVKVARDGTEIEPDIGRTLIQLFHRTGGAPQSISSAAGYQPIVHNHHLLPTGYGYSGYPAVSVPQDHNFMP